MWTAVWRGWRKRCPNCGRGPLFVGWARTVDACPSCHLVYEPNPGDTWAFTIIGDRLPLALGIVIVYFGAGRLDGILGTVALLALCAALVWTAPNRWGVGIALHYLSRKHWPDPSDPIPSAEAADHGGDSSTGAG